MPELPDVTIYIERLEEMIVGRILQRLRVVNAFVLRSVEPGVGEVEGQRAVGARRIGKRIVLALEGELFVVMHLMIAGRLRWRTGGKKVPARMILAEFHFEHGVLYLTEAGRKRRASMHIVRGDGALAQFDRGGLEPLEATCAQFAERLRSENHTVKRALTDPRLFSGIGNAYSDEILHAAQLSPLALTSRLAEDEIARLHEATRRTLTRWITRLRDDATGVFPETVTAFHDAMAVHGRYGKPCPVCGAPVQRIRYADNETNYCARCQTGGRLFADRALSRLLRDDWPRTLEELEE